MRSAATITARTTTAIPTDHQLTWLSWLGRRRISPSVVVAPPGTPRMAGIWRTTISTAIPASTPVITGVDRKSAIHPSRKAPTATSAAPTMRAVTAMARL